MWGCRVVWFEVKTNEAWQVMFLIHSTTVLLKYPDKFPPYMPYKIIFCDTWSSSTDCVKLKTIDTGEPCDNNQSNILSYTKARGNLRTTWPERGSGSVLSFQAQVSEDTSRGSQTVSQNVSKLRGSLTVPGSWASFSVLHILRHGPCHTGHMHWSLILRQFNNPEQWFLISFRLCIPEGNDASSTSSSTGITLGKKTRTSHASSTI